MVKDCKTDVTCFRCGKVGHVLRYCDQGNEGRRATVVKIGKKIGTHSSASVSAYAPRARFVSLTRKKHGCPERAFITNGHASSRRQSRKTTESEDAHASEGRQKKNIKRKNVGQR